MQVERLKDIILRETEALKKLLSLLEKQHDMLLKNDIFALEGIIQELQFVNKEVAEIEVERRREAAGASMSSVVQSFRDEELDISYRSIKKLLAQVQLQKDTNDMLIKQGLSFSNRMLSIVNPDRNVKTYNAYGKMKR
ncbi:MAG: flagellar protein FlgN [Bacillota bacterium]|nr:flagellar protein FlgN [Bacillota bacterium]